MIRSRAFLTRHFVGKRHDFGIYDRLLLGLLNEDFKDFYLFSAACWLVKLSSSSAFFIYYNHMIVGSRSYSLLIPFKRIKTNKNLLVISYENVYWSLPIDCVFLECVRKTLCVHHKGAFPWMILTFASVRQRIRQHLIRSLLVGLIRCCVTGALQHCKKGDETRKHGTQRFVCFFFWQE